MVAFKLEIQIRYKKALYGLKRYIQKNKKVS